jgi:two-component system alkaline phosphatase synthesis response regulator PhoP
MPTENIIVVDDDPVIVRLLVRIINMAGYKTATAYDGQEALTKIRALEPSLVLIDLMMPKLDGIEVCQKIRNDSTFSCQPYIIMLTSQDQTADYEKAKQAGVDEFINKPFTPSKVSARIRAILG